MQDLNLNDPLVLKNSLVVSASAGSGKTFTLTVLVTASLGQEEIRPYEILATTFSEAATADLRERLLRPLDLLAALDEAAWGEVLPVLHRGDEEMVGTVKALLEAGVSSERLRKSCREAAEAFAHWGEVSWATAPDQAVAFWRRIRREAELLQVSTIHGLALSLLKQGEGAPESILDVEHPALLRLLRETLRSRLGLPETDPDHPAASALLAWAEGNWVNVSAGHDSHRDAMGHLDPVDLPRLREACLMALGRSEVLFQPLSANPDLAVDRTNRYSHNFNPKKIATVPGPEASPTDRLKWAGRQSSLILDAKGNIPQYYTSLLIEAYGSLALVAEAWEAWLGGLLTDALATFETRKREHSQGTFGDMVRQALDGLETGALMPPRPRMLLIDECQDNSKAQDAFLGALGAERTVRVGDLKQAIYGFRGGDPELLQAHLESAGEFAFRLPANHRSAPEIVDVVNHYVDVLWPAVDATATHLDGNQVSTLDPVAPVGLVRRVAQTRWADLPDFADWIAALSSNEGWDRAIGSVRKPGRRRRALLLPKRTRLPKLIRMLKAKGIQPYVVAKEGYWDSPGIRLAMAAFEAVAHPDRPLPCVALLRNLLGMKDGEISALATNTSGRRGLPGLGDLDPEAFPEHFRAGVTWLKELPSCTSQGLLGQLLVHGTLLDVVNALQVHGAMEPARAKKNLVGFLSRVMSLPASPIAAFAMLEEARGGKEEGDLPADPGGADLIIQTVHASKGLEFEDVILPMMLSQPQGVRTGEFRTEKASGRLVLGWKLGKHDGPALQGLKASVEARERRDRLNLLYVGLTRAKDRMCLLLQSPPDPVPTAQASNWAHWGDLLAEKHTQLAELSELPALDPVRSVPPPLLNPPPVRTPLTQNSVKEDAHARIAPEVRARSRREGEAMHAYLRDLLVRWEDAEAFAACLGAPPDVPNARENVLRFLESFEAKGWRHLRRRTELPLEGAASSGALGFADLVVWAADRIHLLDFKNSKDLKEADLVLYQEQLQRYAEVLRDRYRQEVEAWLVPLKQEVWVSVPLAP